MVIDIPGTVIDMPGTVIGMYRNDTRFIKGR